jgi:hypothetical protein
MISSMEWVLAEEHRKLKQEEDIKQELLLTISVYKLDGGETKCDRILVEELKKRATLKRSG